MASSHRVNILLRARFTRLLPNPSVRIVYHSLEYWKTRMGSTSIEEDGVDIVAELDPNSQVLVLGTSSGDLAVEPESDLRPAPSAIMARRRGTGRRTVPSGTQRRQAMEVIIYHRSLPF